MPLFLVVGFWLLPFVSAASSVSNVSRAEHKEGLESGTQSEQKPSFHDNILFDLVEAECVHVRDERVRSARVLVRGVEVRCNDIYEPFCSECGGFHHRSSGGGGTSAPASTPCLAASGRPPLVSLGFVTPAYLTPSPLPPPRRAASPTPVSSMAPFDAALLQPLLASPRPQLQPQPPSPRQQLPPAPTTCVGLLPPDSNLQPPEPQLPFPRSGSSISASNPTSITSSITTLTAASFGTDPGKNATMLAAAASAAAASARPPVAKDPLVSSAPSSRRISSGIPMAPPHWHGPLRSSNSGVLSGGSISFSASVSVSNSISSEPVIPSTTSPGSGDGSPLKPGYMRGTAASRARTKSGLNRDAAGLDFLGRRLGSRRALDVTSAMST